MDCSIHCYTQFMNTKTRFTLDMDTLFQRRLKVTAALKGITMREYCLAAIERELSKDEEQGFKTLPFGKESIDRLAALRKEVFGKDILPGDSADFIREARKVRAKSQ